MTGKWLGKAERNTPAHFCATETTRYEKLKGSDDVQSLDQGGHQGDRHQRGQGRNVQVDQYRGYDRNKEQQPEEVFGFLIHDSPFAGMARR